MCDVSLETILKKNEFDSTVSLIKKYYKTSFQIKDCLYYVCNGIFLVEEIENGLPHSQYKEVLQILFLSLCFPNSQLFISTYSDKIIQSFFEVAKEYNKESQCTYFDISDKIEVYSAETAQGFLSKGLDLITEQTRPFNFSLS